jgi:hypothetical protein
MKFSTIKQIARSLTSWLAGWIMVIGAIVTIAALILLLAFHIKRGPGVVLQTAGTGTGHTLGYFGAFFARR